MDSRRLMEHLVEWTHSELMAQTPTSGGTNSSCSIECLIWMTKVITLNHLSSRSYFLYIALCNNVKSCHGWMHYAVLFIGFISAYWSVHDLWFLFISACILIKWTVFLTECVSIFYIFFWFYFLFCPLFCFSNKITTEF